MKALWKAFDKRMGHESREITVDLSAISHFLQARKAKQEKARQDAQRQARINAKWPYESELEAYFGKPGDHQTYVALPYPMKLAWDERRIITRFRCHEAVEASLARIFSEVLNHYGLAEISPLAPGCLRRMPGSAQ